MILLLLKSEGQFKHSGKYALINGRWRKLHHDKPVPKGVAVAAHPHAAGAPTAGNATYTNEQWQSLKLPAENSNASTFNKQIDQLKAAADAGDVTGILGSGYGINTYSKKLAVIANHVLGMLGSTHAVTPGQKPGAHPAVQTAPEIEAGQPAPEPENPEDVSHEQPAQASDALSMPAFIEGKTVSGVVQYYEKVGQKVLDLAAAGDAAALDQMKADGLKANSKGKISNTWSGKTANSKMLLALHAQALEQAKGGAQPVPAADAKDEVLQAAVDHLKEDAQQDNLPAAEKKEDVELVQNLEAAQGKESRLVLPNKSREPAPVLTAEAASSTPSVADTGQLTADQLGKLQSIPWFKLKLPDSNSNSASVNKKLSALEQAAFAGDIAAIEAMQWGKNTYNKKLSLVAQTALAALKEGAPAAYPAMETPPPEQNAGPHEGDVKQGADGMLVLKDGHWVKVEEAKTAEPGEHPVDALQVPDFSIIGGGKWDANYAIAAQALKDIVKNEGAIGLTKGVLISHKDGTFTIQVAGFKLKHVGPPMGKADTSPAAKRRELMHKFVTELKAVAGKPKKAPAKTKAAPQAAAPASSVPAIESMDAWTQTGPQGGSNPGGRFKDADGVEWYCKFPVDEDTAKAEVLSAKLYAALGIAGQDAKLITKGGKVGIASKWTTVSKALSPAVLAKVDGVAAGFGADAWLANWDVVGLGYDNLQIGANGKAHRVDAGGSLMYRAQGGKKAFGNSVIEIDSLRDPKINPQAAAVFGGMTDADITASVAKVLALSDMDVRALVEEHGPGDAKARKDLADTLIARKADLAAKFPKAKKSVAKNISWVRLEPGERIVESGEKLGVKWAKIKVQAKGYNAANIPTPPDFFQNGNQGPTHTWKSSVKHVNEANNADAQSIYTLALDAKEHSSVQSMTYSQIDKATGNKTGQVLPMSQHPAAEIKEYLKQVTSELSAQTQPTYKTVQSGSMTQSYSVAAMSLANEFSPIDYAGFKAHANKAADYLVLSKSAAAVIPVPDKAEFEEQWENISPKLIDFKAKSHDNYKALTSSEQVAAKSYTGSAYANWNEALRTGDVKSSYYKSAQAMVGAFKKAAIPIPEGTILWRGIGVGEDTYKSVAGAVIQDGSFQSCSFGSSPAFSSKKTWLKIHVSKGVKGLHATSFSNFGSGEREIIIQNNVRYAVLGVTHHQNFIDSSGKSHGPKTIVDVLALPHEG